MARPVAVLFFVITLGMAGVAGAQVPCTVTGTVTWNGSPIGAGEDVTCISSTYPTVRVTDATDANSVYECLPEEGYISIEVRGQNLGQCPGGQCSQFMQCNVQGSGTCKNPSATLAMFLPPWLISRLRRLRRRDARALASNEGGAR
ncbi:MAG: hypothetical protein KDA28_08930 [Phycisphaerales bacterium]|nr:hypothetical protein [Phycisphaerales bacterium]